VEGDFLERLNILRRLRAGVLQWAEQSNISQLPNWGFAATGSGFVDHHDDPCHSFTTAGTSPQGEKSQVCSAALTQRPGCIKGTARSG
jgi:hypothetical protein